MNRCVPIDFSHIKVLYSKINSLLDRWMMDGRVRSYWKTIFVFDVSQSIQSLEVSFVCHFHCFRWNKDVFLSMRAGLNGLNIHIILWCVRIFHIRLSEFWVTGQRSTTRLNFHAYLAGYVLCPIVLRFWIASLYDKLFNYLQSVRITILSRIREYSKFIHNSQTPIAMWLRIRRICIICVYN